MHAQGDSPRVGAVLNRLTGTHQLLAKQFYGPSSWSGDGSFPGWITRSTHAAVGAPTQTPSTRQKSHPSRREAATPHARSVSPAGGQALAGRCALGAACRCSRV